LVNASGSILNDAIDGIWFYARDGSWVVKKKSAFSLWNSQGKQAGDIIFDSYQPFSEGNAPVFVNGKWGFMNHSGRLVVPAKFEEVLGYKNGIAYAKENGLWGVLKKNGSWLVKPSGQAVDIDEDGKRHLVLP
jgi:hypothetical protein